MSRVNKNNFRILAIETSCDETSVSVIEVTKSYGRLRKVTEGYEKLQPIVTSCNQLQPVVTILSNVVSSQVKLHAKYGGVYPELASREHIKNIIPVIEQSLIESGIRNQESRFGKQKTGKIHDSSFTIHHSIDYLAVTTGPGLIGSLLVGVNTAKTLAYALQKPIYAINHLEGHIYSCFAGENPKHEARSTKQIPMSKIQNSKRLENLNLENSKTVSNFEFRISKLPKFPILALIVSGGHTALVYMPKHLEYKVIGETLDDAAGEAFDKVAKLLELGYPGGPVIAAEAAKITNDKIQIFNQARNSNVLKLNHLNLNKNLKFKIKNSIKFPRPMLDSPDFDFSFSGLKTAVLYTANKLKSQNSKVKTITKNSKLKSNTILPNEIKALICKEFQDAVVETLVTKTLRATHQYKARSILLCGGVAANERLRQEFESRIMNNELRYNSTGCLSSNVYRPLFFVPPKNLCTDNAAMIGVAAAYRLALGKKPTPWQQINADASLMLE